MPELPEVDPTSLKLCGTRTIKKGETDA